MSRNLSSLDQATSHEAADVRLNRPVEHSLVAIPESQLLAYGTLGSTEETPETFRERETLIGQRLIRVLKLEINNSLAPIKTIAARLCRMAEDVAEEMPISEQLSPGLEVIHERAEALSRFVEGYTILATAAAPARREVAFDVLIARAVELESRLRVSIVFGPKVHLYPNPDQLEQALINLIKNAADA